MNAIIKIENLTDLIVEIRDESVLLDADVAAIYGVETKRINEAVKNNPDKFPQSYMFELSGAEFANLRSKISTTKFAKTRVMPKAFTEKGLYMMATHAELTDQAAVRAFFEAEKPDQVYMAAARVGGIHAKVFVGPNLFGQANIRPNKFGPTRNQTSSTRPGAPESKSCCSWAQAASTPNLCPSP